MAVVNRFLALIINKWVFLLLLVGAIGYGVYTYIANQEADVEQIYTASVGDVTQSVLLSGTVAATEQVDLSFGIAGQIVELYVDQGMQVEEGDLLAELDVDILLADLQKAEGDVASAWASIQVAEASVRKAEANVDLVRAQNRGDETTIESAQAKLEQTKSEQAVLVQNAYRELIENDLQTYRQIDVSNVPPFVITGSYTSDLEGAYTFRAYISSFSNIGYSVDYDGIEKGTVHFSGFDTPEQLGDNGLFISMPSEGIGQNYNNSTWILPIPNNRSATYQTKLSLYNKAKANANLAVTNAENDLANLIAREEGGVPLGSAEEQQAIAALEEAEASLAQSRSTLAQAQAARARVEAQIDDGIILAPFSGVVARIDFTVGETVQASETGLVLITENMYELSMNVPEIDVGKIKIGDTARVTLDVYGNDESWEGTLTEVELVETEVDGVPVYESVITLDEVDSRIRVGMNARAEIVIEEKSEVLSVPLSYLTPSGDEYLATLRIGPETIEEKRVQIGLRGSNNFVEVTSGLASGDRLIKPE